MQIEEVHELIDYAIDKAGREFVESMISVVCLCIVALIGLAILFDKTRK